MARRTWGRVRHRFAGVHCWADAPDGPHAHLRNPHRHEFHVAVDFQQFHDDREIEYLTFKDWLESVLAAWPLNLGGRSCEMMAAHIHKACEAQWGAMRDYRVEVSEDGENGAIVE